MEICPLGHLCQETAIEGIPADQVADSTTIVATLCPDGFFNHMTGRALQSDCQLCTSGNYCQKADLVTPVADPDGTGDCSDNFYCKIGASEPNPAYDSDTEYFYGPCPNFHLCTTGDGLGTPFLPGYYDGVNTLDTSDDTDISTKLSAVAQFSFWVHEIYTIYQPYVVEEICEGGFYCENASFQAYFAIDGANCGLHQACPDATNWIGATPAAADLIKFDCGPGEF